MTTSSSKIKEARLKAGLTQKAAAEYLEMPLRTFQDWEYGSNAPKYVITLKHFKLPIQVSNTIMTA